MATLFKDCRDGSEGFFVRESWDGCEKKSENLIYLIISLKYMENKIFEIIKEFSESIKQKLDIALEKGEVKKINFEQETFRWKLNDFEYSIEKGVSCSGATGKSSSISQLVFIHKIDEELKTYNEYKKFIRELSYLGDFPNIENSIQMFTKKLCSAYLSGEPTDNLLLTFSKELDGEPIKIKAFVELTGLTLEPNEIKIVSGLVIRRPTKEDLEKKHIISPFYNEGLLHLEYPSAIMEIEIFGRSPIELQNYMEKSITLLSLFGSGGVKYLGYNMTSESISIPIGGVVRPGDRSKPPHSYIILNKDIPRLKNFWIEMSKILSLGFIQEQFSSFQPNIFFSYQRYNEAILNGGMIEKRIVNAISGLESLYLNSSQELSRYLRLNVSKTMGILGYDAYKVREEIKDAYQIRSKFIHGETLTYKSRNKLDKKYGSLENLFSDIIDYLRISILLLLGLKKEKDEFIDILEDTFIDKEKEKLFQEQIIHIKNKFGI